MPNDGTGETPEIITAPEASVLLRCSIRSVHRLIDSEQLPVIRKLPGPNGAFLIHRAEVEKLAAASSPA